LLPQCGFAVGLGGVNEKERRLIDDDVFIGLIYDFEVEEWSNGLMEEGMCANSKAITQSLR